MTKKFNIRVYGILSNEKNEILISDEREHGMNFTKFPGGGLEFGEGIVDCLIREFKEELSVDIRIKNLFYITDFFQESAFNSNDQLISIYYNVELIDENQLNIAELNRKMDTNSESHETFRWIQQHEISAETFTFPIDKLVGEKLR